MVLIVGVWRWNENFLAPTLFLPCIFVCHINFIISTETRYDCRFWKSALTSKNQNLKGKETKPKMFSFIQVLRDQAKMIHLNGNYKRIWRPSFLGGTTALFPGNALWETSTRALKVYGSCIESSDKTFLFSWMFSFINPCMKFP